MKKRILFCVLFATVLLFSGCFAGNSIEPVATSSPSFSDDVNIVAVTVTYSNPTSICVAFTDDSTRTVSVAGDYCAVADPEEYYIVDLDADGRNELLVNLADADGKKIDTFVYAIREGELKQVFTPDNGSSFQHYGCGAMVVFIGDMPYVSFSEETGTTLISYFGGAWELAATAD